MSDLYDNPMVRSAKKAMTPEQIEEYKKIGEYMYNNVDYHKAEMETVKQPEPIDLLVYATEALKSGGSPMDLTKQEIAELESVYGKKWYEHFGIEESELPAHLAAEAISAEQAIKDIEERAKKLNLTKKQRKMVEKKLENMKKTVNKK